MFPLILPLMDGLHPFIHEPSVLLLHLSAMALLFTCAAAALYRLLHPRATSICRLVWMFKKMFLFLANRTCPLKTRPHEIPQKIKRSLHNSSVCNPLLLTLHISTENSRKTNVSSFMFHFIILKFLKPFRHTNSTMYVLVIAAKCRIVVRVLVMQFSHICQDQMLFLAVYKYKLLTNKLLTNIH